MANKNGNMLAKDFVTELLAVAFHRQSVFDVCKQYLKFSYLQSEAEKKLWQWAVRRQDKTGLIPTMGQLQQQFNEDEKVLDVLDEIKDVEIDDNYNFEGLIDAFEKFIKKMKFLEVNDRITELYNLGKKEEAYSVFVKGAEDFNDFTIRDAEYETVFGDFAVRQLHRQSEEYNKRYKIPTLIDEIDNRLGGASGGPETGEFWLWLADSGMGKSWLMVQLGISAARQGELVVHFQLEGTKEQCLNRYDAAWTGTLYQEVKVGNIPPKKLEITKRVVEKLKKSDIVVVNVEEFGGLTLAEVRRKCHEIEKIFGRKIGVIIVDYLELLEVGDGHNYTPGEERFRQAKLAKGMKMLAMEFNAVVHSPTQSSNIPEENKQDPEFVITRAQLNEDKGKCRPADGLITLNQTRDEYKDHIMRLHTDKIRDYANGEPIHVYTNFAYGRFYDRQRTLNADWDEQDD